MFLRLLLLFTVVPLVELFLLLQIGRFVGPIPTIGLVLFTGTLGAWLARSQGVQVLRRARGQFSQGEMPTEALVDGVLIFVAGAVLLTPGLLTDLAGFFLLTPFGRAWVRREAMKRIKNPLRQHVAGQTTTIIIESSDIVDHSDD